MFKTLDLVDGDKYTFIQSEDVITVTKYYLNNCELEKTIEIQFSDDFAINAFVVNDEFDDNNCVTFEIKEGEPLYIPLNKFLGNNPKIMIDDDLTRPEAMKFAEISRNNGSIFITVENQLKYNTIVDKYNICVINMMYDGRSKIDQHNYDTKARIRTLFKSVCEEFLNEKVDEKVVVKQITYK